MDAFWAQFHFLRPQWLWALLPMLGVLLLLLRETQARDSWRTAVAEHLLPYLVVGSTDERKLKYPARWMAAFWLLMVFALAGPTWDRADQPGGQDEAALVIALDLSQSMLVNDIQPSRLERAKQKIQDLLNARPGSRTALIVYAGTAHTVVPLSSDPVAIKHPLEALKPGIMPVSGTSLSEALALTDSLLLPIEAASTLLLITDGLEAEDLPVLVQHDTSSTDRVVVWAVGTAQGGAVPGSRAGSFVRDAQGQTVIAQLDRTLLDEASRRAGVEVVTVTLDDSDVRRVTRLVREEVRRLGELEAEEADWNDRGYWLLIPIALISLLWFRKGWVVQWMWLLIVLPLLGGCTPDKTFADYWLSRDQQGRYLLERGDTTRAAQRFDDPMWRGVLHYEMGDYEAALAAFSLVQTPEGYFNMGNTQVQMAQQIRDVEWRDQVRTYRRAIGAYEAALTLQEPFPEAESNKQLVEEEMQRILRRFASAGDTNIGADGMVEEEEPVGDFNDEEQSQEEGGPPEDGPPIDTPPQQSGGQFDPNLPFTKDEAREAVLRQMSSDPSAFLKNKFTFQVQQRKTPVERGGKTW